jgi:hypothetical protein
MLDGIIYGGSFNFSQRGPDHGNSIPVNIQVCWLTRNDKTSSRSFDVLRGRKQLVGKQQNPVRVIEHTGCFRSSFLVTAKKQQDQEQYHQEEREITNDLLLEAEPDPVYRITIKDPDTQDQKSKTGMKGCPVITAEPSCEKIFAYDTPQCTQYSDQHREDEDTLDQIQSLSFSQEQKNQADQEKENGRDQAHPGRHRLRTRYRPFFPE